MTENTIDPGTPEDAIQAYVDACCTADTDWLKDLFHNQAMMSGCFEGKFYIGSPDVFYDEVRDNPLSPGDTYAAEITASATYGNIAQVELQERGYLGKYDLTNLFQLVLVDGNWKIVSKTYTESKS